MDSSAMFDWIVCAVLFVLCVVLNLMFFLGVYRTSQEWKKLARELGVADD